MSTARFLSSFRNHAKKTARCTLQGAMIGAAVGEAALICYGKEPQPRLGHNCFDLTIQPGHLASHGFGEALAALLFFGLLNILTIGSCTIAADMRDEIRSHPASFFRTVPVLSGAMIGMLVGFLSFYETPTLEYSMSPARLF